MFISCLHEEHILYIVITRIVKRDKNLDEEFCVVITSIYSLHMMWVRRK